MMIPQFLLDQIGPSFFSRIIPIGAVVLVSGIAIVLFTALKRLRQSSEHLLVSQQLYRSLFDGTPSTVSLFDRDGRYLAVNESGSAALGIPEGELVGRPFINIWPEDSIPVITAAVTQVCQGKRSTFEAEYLRRDGQRITWHGTLNPIPRQQEPCHQFVGILNDITERKLAERALRDAKEAAEAANLAKNEFLATISHEIRTPMNGIIGMTELTLDTDLTREQREYLGAVKISAENLLGIINDILDFSKIEAGRLELESIPFLLSPTISQTVKTMSWRAHRKNIELILTIGPAVPDALVGDPGRLRQIIFNLVGNAIKFTEKGEIVVSANLELASDTEVIIHFTVSDTGIGIPETAREQIFNPFIQADNSTTRKYGGTGLGLAITKQLVELMKGRIWVESELGKGSVFHFTLSYPMQERSDLFLFGKSPVLTGLSVLIVDDNEINRSLLKGLLERKGMRVTTAAGGDEAFDVIDAAGRTGARFDLILIDAFMPDVNGWDVARKIRTQQECNGSRIILLPSSGQKGDAELCRQIGIDGYLIKPVMPRELEDSIMLVMGLAGTDDAPLVTRHVVHENRQRLRILLADDVEINRKVAARMLEKLGHSVVTVKNGREAVTAWDKGGYNLVFMDIQMPDMDGLQATSVIREKERPSGRHVPIIAMTAYAMKGDDAKCLSAGMDDYISKPVKQEDMRRIIERICGLPTAVTETQDQG